MSGRVALVLDPAFGEDCIALQGLMPVWIVDRAQNRAAVAKVRAAELPGASNLTTFQARAGESAAATCERIVLSLDDHYNEHACTPGYTELDVIGVALGDVSLEPFLASNFTRFEPSATGFTAKKTPASVAVPAD